MDRSDLLAEHQIANEITVGGDGLIIGGERLIILHTLDDDALKEVLTKLGETDLPALWKPRPDQFRKIETMPYLGTGKLDLRRVKELGNELA